MRYKRKMRDFLLRCGPIILSPLVTLFSALVIAIGWIVVHRLSARRDRKNRKEEKITDFLINAYRNIEQACARGPVTSGSKWAEAFECAFADIQLFGSPKQVELVKKIIAEIEKKTIGKTGEATDPRELLANLRHQLRRDLNLEGLDSPIVHYRGSAQTGR